jgi:DHA2 family multidrug resistance protein
LKAERVSVRTNGKLSIDGIGITLIALASAALEVALDRGQIEDWFGSSFICWMLAIGIIGWIATVVWEIRLKEPIIEFRLLASRNFAIASVLFFVFGFGLFGSTTLLPQILQSLYGYRAIDAGLVLGSGRPRDNIIGPDRSAVDPAPDCACPRIARDQPPHYRCCEVALQYLLSRDR